MAKHVVCPATDIGAGMSKLVQIKGRAIVIYELDGAYYGLHNKCPHEGGSLFHGPRVGLVTSTEPGKYCYERRGEFVRCPWHGWEFDIRTGKSVCDPTRYKTRPFPVTVEPGKNLEETLLVADTVKVTVESDYIVVEM